jgi:hypothetical protein
MPRFGDWEFTVDSERTAAAYGRVHQVWSDICDCHDCKNFSLIRARAYPEAFKSLLANWGVDWRRESEAYRTHRVKAGTHSYFGWFHFVGELQITGDFPQVELETGFRCWLCRSGAPPVKELEGLPLVQVEFESAAVPWECEFDEPEF